MISSSQQLGAGYALVPYQPVFPDVIQVPGSNVVRAHAGNTVYRTPHLVVREAEAGSGWPADLSNMMFTPNGQLVPADASARDMFQGAMEPVHAVSVSSGMRGLVPAISMFVGAGLGYKSTSPDNKLWGAVGGAVVGGILGLLFR